MASFATAAELATYMNRAAFTGTELAQATQALDIATALIKSYTGQTIEFVDNETVTLDGRYRYGLLLPELPVVLVNSVVEDGTTLAATKYLLGYGGILYRQDDSTTPPYLTNWSRGIQNIVVNYDHGYSTIPNDIKGVTLAIAARRISGGTSGTVQSETIGPYSVTYDVSSDASEALGSSELLILERYRLPKVPVA